MFGRKILSLLVITTLAAAAFTAAGCGGNSDKVKHTGTQPVTVRVGYFPNITHSQALLGLGDGTFQKALGSKAVIDKKLFNAGPSEIEALLAGEIDLGYIGPVPAINGFVKSHGGLRILAGATNAGAVLVVQQDANINSPADLAGKKVAVPQFGNTQDISLRKIMQDYHLQADAKGGNVTVLQVENPDILTAFAKKELDAALVPEPWGSRLVSKAGGKVLLDWNQVWRNGNYTTAVLIVRTGFLQEHPELVEKWLAAHVELTSRLAGDMEKGKTLVNAQLKELTKKDLSQDILDSSFARLTPTYDPVSDSVREFVTLSVQNGYLKTKPDIDALIDLTILNKVLQGQGKAPVK